MTGGNGNSNGNAGTGSLSAFEFIVIKAGAGTEPNIQFPLILSRLPPVLKSVIVSPSGLQKNL
ncbi:MAG: hypothetical protein WBX81_02060, partial [Nitrososphaeraceae archaeon]